MNKKQAFLWFLLIIVVASFFRLWQIKSVPPGFSYDESMYANNAVEAWKTGNFKIFYTENNGREGLWINIIAPFLTYFGNQPWVSRSIAAIFGILTVIGLYFLTKVLFGSRRTALLASFFLAISFWHVNFSRIGFRAILTPFFLVWSFYFLWSAIRKEIPNIRKITFACWAGLFFGLGFNTYISYRVAPLLLIVPFVLMWKARQKKLIFLFCLFALIVALPIGIYFLKNPQDFFGRASQISVFSAKSPILELGFNAVKTVGMFFVWGDSNWRQNYRGSPELWWPVAILFVLGFIFLFKKLSFVSNKIFLTGWLVVMLLPAVISAEGVPHSLRSIGAVPAVMIFAALGMEWIIFEATNWVHKKLGKYPEHTKQLLRIKKWMVALFFVFLLALANQTFNQYFLRWANNPNVANAFDENYAQLGKVLNALPKTVAKYVIINTTASGIRDNPYEPPVVMFLTDSYVPQSRIKNNIFYVNPTNLEKLAQDVNSKEHFYIAMLEFNPDILLILREKIKNLKIDASSGIIIFYK